MKFYGYSKKTHGHGLHEMKEVTISANPDALKELARFILKCADEIESNNTQFNHDHFQPKDIKVGKDTPEFIISNPRAKF